MQWPKDTKGVISLRLLITPLVSFSHCIVCPLISGFWLPLWYLLVIALSALWFTASGYPFGIFWSLHCLPFDLRLLITPLVSFGHCIVWPLIYGFWLPLWYLLVIALSALWFTASDYSFGIYKLFIICRHQNRCRMVVAKPLLGNNILCRKQCLAWVASVYSDQRGNQKP
jgi:hypothetical protein